MRTGLAKLREQINTHLQTLRDGPHVRREQIRLCYMIVDLQEQVDDRVNEAKRMKLQRELEAKEGA